MSFLVADPVVVAGLLDRQTASPSVRVHGAARLNAVLEKRDQSGRGSIGNVAQPNAADPAAVFLGCHHDQRLANHLPAQHARLFAAQKALIDFDYASQPLAAGPDHGPTQLMQTRPCCLIAAPAQNTLQRDGAYPVLLAGQPPHRAKPHSQRCSTVLKHGPGGRRHLIPTTGALNPARLQRPALDGAATRTTESVRKTKLKKILPASLLSAETPLQLQKRARIILFHGPEHYRLGQPESNGYPAHILFF